MHNLGATSLKRRRRAADPMATYDAQTLARLERAERKTLSRDRFTGCHTANT